MTKALEPVERIGMIVAQMTTLIAVELADKHGHGMPDALREHIKAEAKAAIDRILDQGKTLLDSGNSGWLEALVKTECYEAAKNAVDKTFTENAEQQGA